MLTSCKRVTALVKVMGQGMVMGKWTWDRGPAWQLNWAIALRPTRLSATEVRVAKRVMK